MAMKEYLGLLFSVCIVAAIVKTVSPEGTAKKYVEVICSLCVICVIISPTVCEGGMLSELKEIVNADVDTVKSEYEQMYSSYMRDGQITLAQKALEDELADVFGKDEDAFEVVLHTEYTEDEVLLNRSSVVIGLSAIDTDPEKIKAYMNERTGVECQIIYINKAEK